MGGMRTGGDAPAAPQGRTPSPRAGRPWRYGLSPTLAPPDACPARREMASSPPPPPCAGHRRRRRRQPAMTGAPAAPGGRGARRIHTSVTRAVGRPTADASGVATADVAHRPPGAGAGVWARERLAVAVGSQARRPPDGASSVMGAPVGRRLGEVDARVPGRRPTPVATPREVRRGAAARGDTPAPPPRRTVGVFRAVPPVAGVQTTRAVLIGVGANGRVGTVGRGGALGGEAPLVPASCGGNLVTDSDRRGAACVGRRASHSSGGVSRRCCRSGHCRHGARLFVHCARPQQTTRKNGCWLLNYCDSATEGRRAGTSPRKSCARIVTPTRENMVNEREAQ